MAWHVAITGPAQKDVQKLPPSDQKRISKALVSMQSDPMTGDLKRLKEKPSAWRRRVGNYRILFDIDFEEKYLIVTAIIRRTSTTYE